MMVIGLLLGRLSLTSHRFTTAAASVTLLAAAVVVQTAGSSRINPTGSSKPMLLRRWLNRCVSVAVGGAALLVALTALLP